MIIYASQGSDVLITATVLTPDTPTVQWYHEGDLIASDNSRYNVLPRDGNMYTLRVLNVNSDILGLYTVVATVGERQGHDSVQLMSPGNMRYFFSLYSYLTFDCFSHYSPSQFYYFPGFYFCKQK